MKTLPRDYRPDHHVLDRLESVAAREGTDYMIERAELLDAMVNGAEQAMWRLYRGEVSSEQTEMLRCALNSFLYALEGVHQAALRGDREPDVRIPRPAVLEVQR